MKVAFFIFLVLSTLSPSSCQTPTPVRDIDRNILKAGNNYHILPAMHGVGGGLITARASGELCPTEVAQELSEVLPGTPLNFIPANPNKDGIIRGSTDLNIMFVDPLACVPNAVWRVDTSDVGERTLSSQGLLGRPGQVQEGITSFRLIIRGGVSRVTSRC
nr:Kunitz trypsin inhibitor 2-like [Tanacetum cinerariifolium]